MLRQHLRQPHLLEDVTHRQVERNDFVVDEKLHAIVILQQRDQLTIGTDLVLDIAHQWAK